jgi:hypothetical protein
LIVEIELVDLIAEILDVVEYVLVVALEFGVLEKNGMSWHGRDSLMVLAIPRALSGSWCCRRLGSPVLSPITDY